MKPTRWKHVGHLPERVPCNRNCNQTEPTVPPLESKIEGTEFLLRTLPEIPHIQRRGTTAQPKVLFLLSWNSISS
jgi:hypothetical protein